MKIFIIICTFFVFPLQVSVAATSNHYIYYPNLAKKVLSDDARSFAQVLAKSEVVPNGAKLEELAEISSKYVRINPTEFLRVQAKYNHCFGVGFMGEDYVDNQSAKVRERKLREIALNSISEKSLVSIKQICLAKLNHSIK